MTLTRLNNNPTAGQTTYRWQKSGVTAVIDRKVDQSAHYLFNLGFGDHGTEENPRTYSDLSLAEKLVILDEDYTRHTLNQSKSYKANLDADAARDAAIAAEEGEVIT